MLQWGRSSFTAEIWLASPRLNQAWPAPMCFNGAAVLSLRKSWVTLRKKSGWHTLQWGRSSFTAEIAYPTFGKIAAYSFNGAAVLSLRKLGRLSADAAQMGASMGPQFFHCGNGTETASCVVPITCFNGAAVLSLRKSGHGSGTGLGIAKLQWGRSSFTAEIWPGSK